MSAIDTAYRVCEQISRASGSNFYRSFQFLRCDRRRAMHALYAFARLADDATDRPPPCSSVDVASSVNPTLDAPSTTDVHPIDSNSWDLSPWLNFVEQLDAPEWDVAASDEHPNAELASIRPALADSLARFQIPKPMLAELVRGVDMDTHPQQIVTWSDLQQYTFRVASTIGICCAAIWSPDGPPTPDSDTWRSAIDCGTAFQLTNILRDPIEDARRNRVYLPSNELARFGIDRQQWIKAVAAPRRDAIESLGDWRGLIDVQLQRAEALFDRGWGVANALAPDGLRMFSLMWNTYYRLLQQIRRDPSLIFQRRVRLTTTDKWALASQHWFTPIFANSLNQRSRASSLRSTESRSSLRSNSQSKACGTALLVEPNATGVHSSTTPPGTTPPGTTPRIAIVGGGLSGIQSAMWLAKHGCDVELFEAKSRLGGRVGSFTDAVSGNQVDYCQHVGMQCCQELRRWIDQTGQRESWRTERELFFVSEGGERITVRGWPLPAPFHLTGLLLNWPDLSWSDRWSIGRALLKLIRVNPSDAFNRVPAKQWLLENRQSQRAIDCFWTTILVSALGEQVDRVTMGPVRKVLVDGFAATRDAFHLLIPEQPLSELVDQKSSQVLQSLDVRLRMSSLVANIQKQADGQWNIETQPRATESRSHGAEHGLDRPFDAVIVAVPWHRFASLWRDQAPTADPRLAALTRQVTALESSPITGVHTWWDRPWLQQPHAILINRLCQWIFPGPAIPKGSHGSAPASETYYQIVISGSRPLQSIDTASVLREVQADLANVFPEAAVATLMRGRVVTDPHSVFSVDIGHDAARPYAEQLGDMGLFLAGDWTQTGWPATMEGALRSGTLAAERTLSFLDRPAHLGSSTQPGPVSRIRADK
jgi:squalene-associated FAD-dependent desaturase